MRRAKAVAVCGLIAAAGLAFAVTTRAEPNVDLDQGWSARAIEESARRLGMWEHGKLVTEGESELGLVVDVAIYDHFPTEKNAVERYLVQAKHAPDSEAGKVLEAMSRARFTLRIESGILLLMEVSHAHEA